MREHQNIILLGLMGTGKSAVAAALATRTGWPAVDTDQLIEATAGQPINKIFSSQGEAIFRDLETATLQDLLSSRPSESLIIATGGGIVLRAENRHLLHQLGKRILLVARPAVIIERLRADTTRPLLQGSDAEKLRRLEDLIWQRQHAYQESADWQIDTSDLSVEEIVSQIIAGIRAK